MVDCKLYFEHNYNRHPSTAFEQEQADITRSLRDFVKLIGLIDLDKSYEGQPLSKPSSALALKNFMNHRS